MPHSLHPLHKSFQVHIPEDIPFTTFVDVPGALPGMIAHVNPLVEHISWHLMDPAAVDRRRVALADATADDVAFTFGRLAQKTIIDVGVRVSAPQPIHMWAVPVQPAVCGATPHGAAALEHLIKQGGERSWPGQGAPKPGTC